MDENPSLFPTRSRTAVNTKVSNPHSAGTSGDGAQPKKAVISCPLAYPAPIIVPTQVIATDITFFTYYLYEKDKDFIY
ncbi:MAG: hypothetical protein IJX05_00320 [Clostridia bacterium]|nr:hypothetical protein [Clostridia bacterium]